MCLVTSRKEPFVAKKDIICYKELIETYTKDGYVTPYRDIPVELNTMLEAGSDKSYEGCKWNNCEKHVIGEGFVHAYLGDNVYYKRFPKIFKAIIPAGTEFYIDDDCGEICAREMFITNEEVKMAKIPDCKSVIRELFNDYFSDLFVESIPGVGIGYYYLSDGSYVNPKDITEERKKDVIGIVSHIREEKVHIVSVDETFDNWHEAVKWVNNYFTEGTEPGDWYLGNVDEVQQMALNLLTINLAISLLDFGTLMYSDTLYFTSTPYLGINTGSFQGFTNKCFRLYTKAFLCKDL